MIARFKTLSLFLGSVLFAAILAELALRIALPHPIVWKYPQESYIYDSEIGHRLKPNQAAFTHDKVANINSAGIRGPEYPRKVSPTVYRLIAMGDSQTFGNGLKLTDTWPKQLETILNQAGNERRVEVLNYGLPASDTWQHEIMLKRILNEHKLDAIVLGFYVNDVVKKIIPANLQSEVHGELSTRIAFFLKRSAILLTLRTAWSAVKQRWFPSMGFLLQQALLKGENSPALDERWNQVERSLSAMKKASDEHGISFGVILLPRRDQIDGRMPWDAYNDRLQAIAERYNILMLSMFDPLQQSYQTHGKDLFIPWDGHNSKKANLVIAREVADKMFTVLQGMHLVDK